MRYEVFKAFMEFYRTHCPELSPSIYDLKVYLLGGCRIRIGPCIFKYIYRTRTVEQISGLDWDTFASANPAYLEERP